MMEWINIFGAVFIAVIMVPNIIFTLKYKDGFENKWNNKGVEVVEQIGSDIFNSKCRFNYTLLCDMDYLF